jgi:hypothetical protein
MKVTFCKTKAGKGFKIAVDKSWLYVSKERLLAVIDGDAKSCQFTTLENSDSSFDEFENPLEDSSQDESFLFAEFPSTNSQWE